MRFALLALLAGCYAPSVTAGAPCDPQIGNCPRPLMCVAGPTGYTCERSAPGPGDGDAAIDSPIDSPTSKVDASVDAMIDAPPMIDAPTVTHVEYPSVVADCVNRNNPNPDTCINVNGTGQLAIDKKDSGTNNPWDAFVRFDLDGVIAGRTITSVKLKMTTTDDSKAPAPDSGVVYQVQMFTRQSLFTAEPAKVSQTPIAGSQGAVGKNQDVLWPLPDMLPVATGSVYLEILTTNDDGTTYWNQTDSRRPRLVIDMAP